MKIKMTSQEIIYKISKSEAKHLINGNELFEKIIFPNDECLVFKVCIKDDKEICLVNQSNVFVLNVSKLAVANLIKDNLKNGILQKYATNNRDNEYSLQIDMRSS